MDPERKNVSFFLLNPSFPPSDRRAMKLISLVVFLCLNSFLPTRRVDSLGKFPWRFVDVCGCALSNIPIPVTHVFPLVFLLQVDKSGFTVVHTSAYELVKSMCCLLSHSLATTRPTPSFKSLVPVCLPSTHRSWRSLRRRQVVMNHIGFLHPF